MSANKYLMNETCTGNTTIFGTTYNIVGRIKLINQ